MRKFDVLVIVRAVTRTQRNESEQADADAAQAARKALEGAGFTIESVTVSSAVLPEPGHPMHDKMKRDGRLW